MSRMTCTAAICVLAALVSVGAAAAPQSTPTPGDASSVSSFDAVRSRADEARAAGRLEEAIEFYGRAVRLRPSWTEGYWYLGAVNYEIENYAQCRNAFREVVRLQKQNGAAWALDRK